jgi:hypothetical protein
MWAMVAMMGTILGYMFHFLTWCQPRASPPPPSDAPWSLVRFVLGAVLNPNLYLPYASAALAFMTFVLTKVGGGRHWVAR